MRTSRKGTRLNDAQYFKNPLPHARQKMTEMFILQRVPNLQKKYSWDIVDLVSDVRSDPKTKNRRRKINFRDKSIEMASVTREDGSRVSNEKEFSEGFFHREVCVETNENLKEGLSTPIVSKMDQSDVRIANADILRNGKEKIIENDEIRGERTNDGHVRCENRRHSSRWRNSWITQFIFHLFSQIMGRSRKRDETNEDEESIARKSRSYLGYRKEENTIVDERSHEEIVSTFVRQIQRTRDKNLRVMLLQRELEARLSAENISHTRVYDEKLASPQLSSPLC